MADYNIQKANMAGLKPAYAAVSATDTFFNDGYTFVHVKNGGASATTVTINSLAQCSQGFTHDLSFSIPAGEDRMIGPFDTNRFNDLNGKATIKYSATTSVTAAAIRLGN